MSLPLPLDPLSFSFLMLLHCIIGAIAALVAQRKGLSFSRWLVWGLIGGTIALITALLAKPKTQ